MDAQSFLRGVNPDTVEALREQEAQQAATVNPIMRRRAERERQSTFAPSAISPFLREPQSWIDMAKNVPGAIQGATIGNTPAEFAFNVATGPFKGLGPAVRLAAGSIAGLTASDDAEAILPGGRKAMLSARQQVVDTLRGRKGAEGALVSPLDPREAQSAALAAQKSVNVGKRLNGPVTDPRTGAPMAGPNLEGYDMFDYRNLGRSDTPQFSLLRDAPAQNRFEKVPDPVQAMVADPYVYRNMEKAMKRGSPWQNWYDVSPYGKALQNEGMSPQEFSRYMAYQQAAAQNVSPVQQTKIGNYLWHADKNGLLLPESKMVFPPGYGSKGQGNIFKNAQGIHAGTPITSQKLESYGENFGGNWAPGTMDTHGVRLPAMLSHDPRLLEQQMREKTGPGSLAALEGFPNVRQTPDGKFTMWSPRQAYEAGKLTLPEALKRPGVWYTVPSGSGYGALEQYLYKPLAEKLGMQPAQSQAAAWVGGGDVTGLRAPPKLMLQMFEDNVKDLMARDGLTVSQALRGIARGQTY